MQTYSLHFHRESSLAALWRRVIGRLHLPKTAVSSGVWPGGARLWRW